MNRESCGCSLVGGRGRRAGNGDVQDEIVDWTGKRKVGSPVTSSWLVRIQFDDRSEEVSERATVDQPRRG